MTTEKKLLKVDEACQRYSIGKWTLYKWALEGKIPSVKLGKLRRFPVEVLDKLFLSKFDEK